MQVFIKLRSTTTVAGPDTSSAESGMSYDVYGYACTFYHFISFLKNPAFGKYVEQVKEQTAGDSAGKKGPAEEQEEEEDQADAFNLDVDDEEDEDA